MATPLSKKLQIKPGMRLALIEAPAGFEALLAPLPDGARVVPASEDGLGYLHVFANDAAVVRQHVPAVLDRLVYDGVFWISWPKKSAKVPTDLTRDVLWGLLAEDGYDSVASVSIDAVWSALRFRPAAEVKRSAK
jgi:hypothetical protein